MTQSLESDLRGNVGYLLGGVCAPLRCVNQLVYTDQRREQRAGLCFIQKLFLGKQNPPGRHGVIGLFQYILNDPRTLLVDHGRQQHGVIAATELVLYVISLTGMNRLLNAVVTYDLAGDLERLGQIEYIRLEAGVFLTKDD